MANRNVEGERRVARGGRSPASGATGHFCGSRAREYAGDPIKRIVWACVGWECGTTWSATHGTELEGPAYIHQDHGDHETRK